MLNGQLSISFGAGVECPRNKKFHYIGRAKKSFQVTTNGTANFNVKGRCTIDEDLKPVGFYFYGGNYVGLWPVMLVLFHLVF